MSRYILVHGAWEGAWSWENVIPILEKQGHRVEVIELPGSFSNMKPIHEVTLDSYVQLVTEQIKSSSENVVLVGHSLGGVVISQVAEQLSDRIEKLVFVTAFLIENGATALGAMQSDADGQMLPNIMFSDDQTYGKVPEDVWREVAFHDAEESDVDAALSRTSVKQATEPFLAELNLTPERFGSVPKSYIKTSIDRVLSPALQDRMIQSWDVEDVVTLKSGHFPALSIPTQLAKAIMKLSEVVDAI